MSPLELIVNGGCLVLFLVSGIIDLIGMIGGTSGFIERPSWGSLALIALGAVLAVIAVLFLWFATLPKEFV